MNSFKRIPPKLLRTVNLVLNPIEPLLAPHDFPREHAPVFIIGAPRSGSTLFYQALINYFDFGYLTNFHCKYYGFPSLAHRIARPWMPDPLLPVAYRSEHGKTEGLWSPSECGEFWYRWFRRKPHYVSLEEADPRKMVAMRRVVSALIKQFGKPLLLKNMNCALRLRPLIATLPEALFLVIHRDASDCAASLLNVRKKVHGDIATWWSMEPPDVEELRKLSPQEQVYGQIESIYRLIKHDAAAVRSERFFYVQYEEFCVAPNKILNDVSLFLKSHGLQVATKGCILESFHAQRHEK